MASRQTAEKISNGKGLKDNPQLAMAPTLLAEAAVHGWTPDLLTLAGQRLGLHPGKVNLLFPGGVRDAVQAAGEWIDAAMLAQLAQDHRFRSRRTRDKVAAGVMARLEALQPYREGFRRLLQWYALPQYLPLAAKRLYQTVDLIWREAGDTATDFNFYTKRGLLAGVVKATTFYWLTDDSPRQQDTRAFLDRRITEVLRAGKAISLAREWTPQEWLQMARERLRRAT